MRQFFRSIEKNSGAICRKKSGFLKKLCMSKNQTEMNTSRKEKNELADKPGSVLNSHSSRPNVTIWLKQPTQEIRGPRTVDQQPIPLFGLAPDGVYPAIECYHRCGALLPHHFTLTQSSSQCLGGIFSVALSVGSHPPGITWHLALWSPDFPPWR